MSDFSIFANEIQPNDSVNLFDAVEANPDNKNQLPEVITMLTGDEYAVVTSKTHQGDRIELEVSYYYLNFKLSFYEHDEIDIWDINDEDD